VFAPRLDQRDYPLKERNIRLNQMSKIEENPTLQTPESPLWPRHLALFKVLPTLYCPEARWGGALLNFRLFPSGISGIVRSMR